MLVCVELVGNPDCWFSHMMAHYDTGTLNLDCLNYYWEFSTLNNRCTGIRFHDSKLNIHASAEYFFLKHWESTTLTYSCVKIVQQL